MFAEPCDRSFWVLYRDSIRYRGSSIANVQDVDLCLASCAADPDCFAADFDQRSGGSCWSHPFEHLTTEDVHDWNGANPDEISHYTFFCNGKISILK